MNGPDVDRLTRESSWDGVRAAVLGFGGPGFAAADNLTHLGAAVTALADDADAEQLERAELLEILGARVDIHPGATTTLPADVDLVVTTEALAPSHPVMQDAAARGLPVWGDVELAWRLRAAGPSGAPAPWLCLTGGSGTGPAGAILDSILRAAGTRTVLAGTGELPLVEAVMDPAPYEVFVVELSGAQLHHTVSMSAESAAVLDVVPDAPHAGDLGRIYHQVQRACVYHLADPATEALVREAEVIEGARAIGITAGMPSAGMLGVVEDILVDRAFIAERATSAAELGTLADLVPDGDPGPELVTAALAAAALARAHGVTQAAVRDGLQAFTP